MKDGRGMSHFCPGSFVNWINDIQSPSLKFVNFGEMRVAQMVR
jgi:hypothetical protein